MMWQISDLIVLIISTSLTGSILFGLVIIVQRLFTKYMKVRWIFLLMKLVLLFFLVPAIMMSMSTFYFITKIEPILIKGIDNLTANMMSEFDTFGTISPGNVGNSKFFILVFVVWTLGFTLFYLFNLLRDIYALKRLTLISRINEDDKLEKIKQSVVTSLGIRKTIPIYRNNIIEQPFITGVINAKIFLPDIEVSDNVWQLIIRHELIHYKSKDLFFKRVAMFIQGIHWFNPFIYLFCQYFYDVLEITCDEKLLYKENKTVRSEYAHAILNLLSTGKVMKGISGFYSDNVTSLERNSRGNIENHYRAKTKVNLVRYADDFIITADSKEIAEDLKHLVSDFLQSRGLQLSEEKTAITHIDNGFDFLGWNFRKFKGKLIVKPSKDSVKRVVRKLSEIILGESNASSLP